jgi:hypothetical protein
VSNESVNKINEAIKACLHRCYSAELPLAKLAEFLQTLRNDPSWNESEIILVESGARQMLMMIARPSDSSIFTGFSPPYTPSPSQAEQD